MKVLLFCKTDANMGDSIVHIFATKVRVADSPGANVPVKSHFFIHVALRTCVDSGMPRYCTGILLEVVVSSTVNCHMDSVVLFRIVT